MQAKSLAARNTARQKELATSTHLQDSGGPRVLVLQGDCRAMKYFALLTLSTWMLAATSRAEDALDNWPHWRGPEANGTAPKGDPPIKWDEKKNIKWKASLTGRGSGTPIVWGDQVFIVTAIKTDRVAKADELPKPNPKFEKKTTAPTHFYKFVVQSFDRKTGE